MSELKTNYKDDVLDVSKNTQRKYRMINNSDGTVSFEDATVYSQSGDTFGAKDINETNTEINALSENLTNCVIYNPNDDYLYIDNVKWMLAELKTEFLYNNGETDKQFTLATESNGYVTHGETLSKTSNTLIFSSSMVSGSHFASGFLSTNVDLSRFSKLKCTITASGTISAFFGVANKKLININDSPSNILASQCITNNDNSFDLSIDITSINGQCEVGFWFGSDNTPGSRTITIEKVWLEI